MLSLSSRLPARAWPAPVSNRRPSSLPCGSVAWRPVRSLAVLCGAVVGDALDVWGTATSVLGAFLPAMVVMAGCLILFVFLRGIER